MYISLQCSIARQKNMHFNIQFTLPNCIPLRVQGQLRWRFSPLFPPRIRHYSCGLPAIFHGVLSWLWPLKLTYGPFPFSFFFLFIVYDSNCIVSSGFFVWESLIPWCLLSEPTAWLNLLYHFSTLNFENDDVITAIGLSFGGITLSGALGHFQDKL